MSISSDVATPATATQTAASLHDSDADGIPDARTREGAASLAAEIGESVEDVSSRTEKESVLVHPDATYTVREYGTPVRILAGGGDPTVTSSWHDVDYSLVPSETNEWRPSAAPVDVRVGGGASNGDAEIANVSFDDSASLTVTWPVAAGQLPTPQIEGGTAVYELSETTDVLAAVTSDGVAVRLRINERPTTEAALNLEADGVEFGLRTGGDIDLSTVDESGLADETLDEVEAGGLVLTDSDGNLVGGTAGLTAWDAQVDDGGSPIEKLALDSDLQLTGSSGQGSNRVVAHELTLAPPDGFLLDPSTVYPVIIDPDISSLTRVQDSWVRNGVAVSNGSDSKLVVGKDAANSNPAHSFVHFDGSAIAGKNVLQAKLGLYQYQAGSCSPRTMFVHAVSGTWTEANVRWGNQPGVNPSGYGTLSANNGQTCSGSATAEVNVTGIVQSWATNAYANRGLRLAADAASDATFARRFCSMNADSSDGTCNTAQKTPYLAVTYNGPPGAAAAPTYNSWGVTRAWPADRLTVPTTSPTFTTRATHPHNVNVQYQFEARATGVPPAICTTALGAAGRLDSCQLANPLTAGISYSLRARAIDSYGEIGPWSSPRNIRAVSGTNWTPDTPEGVFVQELGTISTRVSDPGGGSVKATFVARRADGTEVWRQDSAFVTSGQVASVNYPTSIFDSGELYYVEATAHDGTLASDAAARTAFNPAFSPYLSPSPCLAVCAPWTGATATTSLTDGASHTLTVTPPSGATGGSAYLQIDITNWGTVQDPGAGIVLTAAGHPASELLPFFPEAAADHFAVQAPVANSYKVELRGISSADVAVTVTDWSPAMQVANDTDVVAVTPMIELPVTRDGEIDMSNPEAAAAWEALALTPTHEITIARDVTSAERSRALQSAYADVRGTWSDFSYTYPTLGASGAYDGPSSSVTGICGLSTTSITRTGSTGIVRSTLTAESGAVGQYSIGIQASHGGGGAPVRQAKLGDLESASNAVTVEASVTDVGAGVVSGTRAWGSVDVVDQSSSRRCFAAAATTTSYFGN